VLLYFPSAIAVAGVAMPRRSRITVAEVPVHIIQRGNNRGACFFADADYELYLAHLQALAAKFECAVHAYCLMTNHVHLLLTPRKADGCALLMKHLGQRYVQHVNRTYRRSGTLWEGRFRSCLAQSERYVLACYRYIELNPHRAGMASHPRQYRWSSYRINAEGMASHLIEPHDQYVRLGRRPEARHEAYRALFREAFDEAVVNEIRAATNGGFVLGAARFQEKIAAMLGRRVTPGQAGRPPRKETERASAGPNRLQDRPMRDGSRRRKDH
ncbi:transposase, partial [Bradyrhizobium sp.]|uniref:transposase n=1 Tax=Bradyrhizobium sp. TaxID=376 RepID=UPI003C193F55